MAGRIVSELGCVVAVALTLAIAGPIEAATLYVAHTGVDSPSCGPSDNQCRSISWAIANAAPGDTILVGPGRYGDLNKNGTLGEPGEESGSPFCVCVLLVNKNVTVISSAGAAATFIDGTGPNVGEIVDIVTDGGTFGQPGKGFTVAKSRLGPVQVSHGHGIVIDSTNVSVKGNRVVGLGTSGTGILQITDAPILVEGNEVVNWGIGIEARAGTTVRKNQVSHNERGIRAVAGMIVGNLVFENSTGIHASGSPTVESNGVNFNRYGIYIEVPYTGTVRKNNIFGNYCGLIHNAPVGLSVPNNYWGSPDGPDVPEADVVCVFPPRDTQSPFLTKPVKVVPLRP